MAPDAAATGGGGGRVSVDERAEEEVQEEAKDVKEEEQGLECVVFTLIVDDIVMPDGTTAMAQLGGGGPQTAFGYALWADAEDEGDDVDDDADDVVERRVRVRRRRARVGLAAGVGEDLPQSCRVWRTHLEKAMLLPPLDTLPTAYSSAQSYHCGVHPEYPPQELLAQLRAITERNNGVLSVEPFTHATRMLTWHELSALASAAHIFSPNRLEAESMVGPGDPVSLAGRLAEAGTNNNNSCLRVVAVRCGEDGAVVRSVCEASVGGTSVTWGVPACEVSEVVDVTGCGNAFCGGFLDGYVRTRDVLTAAVQGVVAASFVAECVGLPVLRRISRREVMRRTEWVRARATRLA